MGLFQITAVPQNGVSQIAICGHNTQTFTSEQNLKSLGLFPGFRVYEVFSNIMSMQLSTNSRQSLWTSGTRQAAEMSYLAAGHVPPTTSPHERMNMREVSFTLKPADRIPVPFSLLPTTLYRWHQIYSSSPDLADGPLQVRGCPPGPGLITNQTSMDAKPTSKHFLTERPWAYESGESRWGTLTIPKSQELKTVKACFIFLLTCAFYVLGALFWILFFPQSRTQANGAVGLNMVSL